jgi:hypothetical protein
MAMYPSLGFLHYLSLVHGCVWPMRAWLSVHLLVPSSIHIQARLESGLEPQSLPKPTLPPCAFLVPLKVIHQVLAQHPVANQLQF